MKLITTREVAPTCEKDLGDISVEAAIEIAKNQVVHLNSLPGIDASITRITSAKITIHEALAQYIG